MFADWIQVPLYSPSWVSVATSVIICIAQGQIDNAQNTDTSTSSGGSGTTGSTGSTGATGSPESTGTTDQSPTASSTSDIASSASTKYGYWAYTEEDETLNSSSQKLTMKEVAALVFSFGFLCCVIGAWCLVCCRKRTKVTAGGVADDDVTVRESGYDMTPIEMRSTNAGENENEIMIDVQVTGTNQ